MKLWPFSRKRNTTPSGGALSPAGEVKGWVSFSDLFRSDSQWFQKGLDLAGGAAAGDLASNTSVYSCVNILSQEVASLKAHHYKVNERGGREKQKRSAVQRVLRKPNPYQTASDFWLYQLRALLLNGNMVGVAERNGKTEVTAIHPRPPTACTPMIAAETGEVFYKTGDFGDALFRSIGMIPATNVMHVRLNCNRHPLIGETPLAAMQLPAITGSAIQHAVARFHSNMSRPSGILMTPKTLTKKQIEELREQFEQVSSGANMGKTPVLHTDLKWESITMTASDAETIASYQLTVADVAMAYRVPLFMLGDLSKASFRNVETLFRVFYTSSLRFYLEHIENALNELFELDGEEEYIEFDIEGGLLRGDLRERMEAYTKGVQGGIYTPNEGRAREGLPPVKGGDEAFLQRQMVPISKIGEILENEADRAAAAAASSGGDDKERPDDEDEDDEKSEKEYYDDLREYMQ